MQGDFGAGEVSQQQPDIVELSNVTYTTCDPGSDDWQLSTGALELDQAEGVVGIAQRVCDDRGGRVDPAGRLQVPCRGIGPRPKPLLPAAAMGS